MRARRVSVVMATTLFVVVGCQGDEADVSDGTTPIATPPATDTTEPTVTTSTDTTSIDTTSTSTTQPAPSTSSTSTTPSTSTSVAPPGASPDTTTVLVVDVDGVWWWSEAGRRLAIDGAIGSAIPDRAGGIVYQEVETGVWRASQSGSPPNTATWSWVGTGSAQPIRRLLGESGESETVVEPPADGMVRIVDTAVVDGAPALAYLRTRHFAIAADGDENPWWDSRIAELVVRDLQTGVEQVVRSQSIGWEYDERIPTLGEDVAGEVVNGYGDGGSRIELLPLRGTPVIVIDEQVGCEFSCPLVADLGPTGAQLAYSHPRPSPSGPIDHEVGVALVDHRHGSEEMSTDLSLPEGTGVVSVDTVDGEVLAVPGSMMAPDGAAPPIVSRGDRGPWVVVLQQRLSQVNLAGWEDVYVAPDGRFGPRTETIVGEFQTAVGLTADGIAGPETWSRLVAESGRIDQLHDPVLIDADGSSRELPVLPSGVTPARHLGPAITLWSE